MSRLAPICDSPSATAFRAASSFLTASACLTRQFVFLGDQWDERLFDLVPGFDGLCVAFAGSFRDGFERLGAGPMLGEPGSQGDGERSGFLRQVDRLLVNPGQGELAEKVAGVEIAGDQLVGEEFQELGLTGGVVRDDAGQQGARARAHHHGPEAIGDVFVERPIGRLMQRATRASARRLTLGTLTTPIGRFDVIFVARRKGRLGQLGFAEDSWARHMFIIFDEYGVVMRGRCRLSRRGR